MADSEDTLDLLPRHLLQVDTRASNIVEANFTPGPVDESVNIRQYKFFVAGNSQYIGTL